MQTELMRKSMVQTLGDVRAFRRISEHILTGLPISSDHELIPGEQIVQLDWFSDLRHAIVPKQWICRFLHDPCS